MADPSLRKVFLLLVCFSSFCSLTRCDFLFSIGKGTHLRLFGLFPYIFKESSKSISLSERFADKLFSASFFCYFLLSRAIISCGLFPLTNHFSCVYALSIFLFCYLSVSLSILFLNITSLQLLFSLYIAFSCLFPPSLQRLHFWRFPPIFILPILWVSRALLRKEKERWWKR